jgi:hypothetical protein
VRFNKTIRFKSPVDQIFCHRQLMIAVSGYQEPPFCLGMHAVKPHEAGNKVVPTGDVVSFQLFCNQGASVSLADQFMGFSGLFDQAFIFLLPKTFGTPFL